MTLDHIAENLQAVREQIDAAARQAGRDPAEVTLVAVSKVHPAEVIEAAYAAGQRDFGENYAQELKEKSEKLAHLSEIRWHFIGHLQRNKVKYVVPTGALVETVDSLKLAEELNAKAAASRQTLSCLAQVNVGGEEQKSGCAPEEAASLLGGIEAFEHLRLEGLMTIPPFELEASETRVYFQKLKKLQTALGGTDRLPHLSMGMSHDFKEAIAQGATIVRVGTAIFGNRPYKNR